ncbi:Taurine-transporting ATPase [Rhizobium sp. CF080]|jgi:NitT/TauT family transport system ATP-binding protein|uniref:ABC transporter ATP-binding protein n=1 Tax=Rhizobium sp. (strain CF080) TaxID=1144310 RepID=UPI000271D73E|nr:ABC transporter ATP-binding protein [Rhizobium sp. CF080]EUB99176.1 Taurine-transporting ATPase [Rhizobium sp. CF080]
MTAFDQASARKLKNSEQLFTGTEVDKGMKSAEPLITFRNVCLDFVGRRILQDINLSIGRQEFVCVVGPSGCGKTTTLRLIAGLLQPTSGEIVYNGKPVREPARDIAVVFQDYTNALLPWRTAAGNVSLALEAAGVPRTERPDRIAALLEKVGLGNRGEAYPSELSGGMQQRLQIARCLAQEPSVLLMDEPFGALDAMTRQHLQDQVLRIMDQSGTTVFFVTHDLEEAIYLADRVIALAPNPGRVAEVFDIKLPRPRNQLTTREDPEFLRLRRKIFDFVQESEA